MVIYQPPPKFPFKSRIRWVSCYLTPKPETIEEEIEFTPGTKESAAHFSLALDRVGLTAASIAVVQNRERKGQKCGRRMLLRPKCLCALFVPGQIRMNAGNGYPRTIKMVLKADFLGSSPTGHMPSQTFFVYIMMATHLLPFSVFSPSWLFPPLFFFFFFTLYPCVLVLSGRF